MLVGLLGVVEPVANAGVSLPGALLHAGELALFDVQHAHLVDFRPAVLLGVHGLVGAVDLDGVVIQVGDSVQAGLEAAALLLEGQAGWKPPPSSSKGRPLSE